VQRVGAVSASSSRIALLRSVFVEKNPRCLRVSPPCALPSFLKRLFAEVWVGGLRGQFVRVAGGTPPSGSSCNPSLPVDVDVSGGRLAYLERTETCSGTDRRSWMRVVVIAAGRRAIRRTVINLRRQTVADDIAVAGHYVAWGENLANGIGGRPQLHGRIVVYDVVARKVAYRVTATDLASTGAIAFDLAPDGKTAVVAEQRLQGECGGPLRVAWISPVPRRIHFLPLRAATLAIAVAGEQLLFAPRRAACSQPERLAVVGLRGETRTVVEFNSKSSRRTFLESFDFDASRFAFAVTQVRSRASIPAGRERYETSLRLGRLVP
jgi:hypothetical protein